MTQLIHIPISASAFGQWSGRRRFFDQDTALHAFVTGLFGRDTLQPFRYFETGGSGAIYGYSAQDAEDLMARITQVATPDVEQVLAGEVKSKVMPVIEAGTRIGFDLKTCPVRRRNGRETDAYDVDRSFERNRSREESYQFWLRERLGEAADLEVMRISQFSKIKTVRKKRKVSLPTVTLHGTLLVKDTEAFNALIQSGIGRQKSYGYGQILLRPAD